MNRESQLATENLEARLAEELEERTEFCRLGILLHLLLRR